MFTKEIFIKRKIKIFAWKIFNKLENNNNTDFQRNGEKTFIENLFRYWKNCNNRRRVIFDVGANVGKYSEMLINYAQKFRLDFELHIFEPTKYCYSTLLKKFSNLDNVIINNFGVSNIEHETKIYYDEEGSGLASIYKRELDNLVLDKRETIKLIRLEDYIAQKQISHIDFLKLDIEGHELFALEGLGEYLNSDFIDFIQFEYGGCNVDSRTYLRDFYDILGKKGFVIAKIMPNGLELKKYSPIMENFQYSNYIAISEKVFESFKYDNIF